MLGTVLSADGLIVVPLSTLDVASTVDGRTVNGPQGPIKLSAKGTTKEVKILMPDGSEVAAKVAFKDPDLDLAFIRPEKAGRSETHSRSTPRTTRRWRCSMTSIILGRLGKDLNREPVVMTTEVVSIITKPRTFGKIGGQCARHAGLQQGRQVPRHRHQPLQREGRHRKPGPGCPPTSCFPPSDLLEAAAQAK